MLLNHKTAVISGAASQRGIGVATARLFAQHGARVAILVGIQFGETVNGFDHWEKNGEFNALSVVKTDSI